MKLFTAIIHGIGKKVESFVTYELANNKEEAHGKISKRMSEKYKDLKFQQPTILEIPQQFLSQVILNSDSKQFPIETNKETDEALKLLANFATQKEYPWFVRGSTVTKMSSDVYNHMHTLKQIALGNFNYAAKLQTQRADIVKQIDEIKLNKIEQESELERLRKQVEFLQESNKILENTNSSLREETKSLNKKLSEQDVTYRELERINVNLNDTINNYELTIQNREDEADANKRTANDTKHKLDKLKEDIFWLYGEACDIEGVKS